MMNKYRLTEKGWLFIFLGAGFLRFYGLGTPAEVTFDEVLIGGFLSHYFTGAYYFDIHPPHLKLWYAGLVYLGGFNESLALKNIFSQANNIYESDYYLWARAFAALCGSLVPVLSGLIALRLGVSRLWAYVLAIGLMCDSALIVESRFMLNDMPLLCLGLLGWWSFLKALDIPGGDRKWTLVSCIWLALASGVKWTGLGFSLPVLGYWFWGLLRHKKWKESVAGGILWASVLLSIQGLGFGLHLMLLPYEGSGNAFMSEAFNARLKAGPKGIKEPQQSKEVHTPMKEGLSLGEAVVELNEKMAFYATKVGGHPYSSAWWSWPLGLKGIYIWNDRSTDGWLGRVYLVPNLWLWWSVMLGVLRVGLIQIPRVIARIFKWRAAPVDWVRVSVLGAYLSLWLPFAWIDRPMFLYHYFPALICGVLLLGLEASDAEPLVQKWMAFIWLIGCIICYLWVLPLIYGISVNVNESNWIFMLKNWI